MIIKVLEANKIKIIECSSPVLISEIILENSIALEMPCGGNGICKKCKIRAVGQLSSMSQREKDCLTELEISSNIRMACMTYIVGDCEIFLQTDHSQDKIITKINVHANSNFSSNIKYGIAVDIGTTTVVSYLFDIKNQRLLCERSTLNPQRNYGADVVSRIEAALNGNLSSLSSNIRICINDLASEMVSSSKISSCDVETFVITGNTTMLLILCNENVEPISHYPFELKEHFDRVINASDLGLNFNNAKVFLPYCLSAFVGADTTTAALSIGLAKKEHPSILVDIGTNSEMVLANGGKLLCSSAAAGPAFEGGSIEFGMGAKDGAICNVQLVNGKIISTVLGNKKAIGICGSGIIDAVSTMLLCGIIDDCGIILDSGHDYEHFVKFVEDSPAFTLPDTQITISQRDIREIQLTKAAVSAGILSLLNAASLSIGDVDSIYFAGGFGSTINFNSAERIGLIPKNLAKKCTSLGNAAASGAVEILLDNDILNSTTDFINNASLVQLAGNAFFEENFVNNMYFET